MSGHSRLRRLNPAVKDGRRSMQWDDGSAEKRKGETPVETSALLPVLKVITFSSFLSLADEAAAAVGASTSVAAVLSSQRTRETWSVYSVPI